MPEAEIAATPQPSESKSTDWPKMVLAIVLGLALLAVAACVGYWYGTESAKIKTQNSKLQPKTQIQETPTPEPTIPSFTNPTANWKTYTNTKHGYRLKYPPNWAETPCQGGTLNDDYFCLLSPDFEGSLEGSLLKGGRIVLSINDGKNAPVQPNCPENIHGYKFPCSEIQVADLKGWRSVIPESSNKIPTYPHQQNTMYFISNIIGGKQFMFLAEYNKESRFTTQSIFDQILPTFKFLD